jgi:molybdopterin-guanine dinucleotide biosynthesis protein
VLIEGFKGDAHPKLQVIRPDHDPNPLPPEVENIVAYASDAPADLPAYTAGKPVFALDDVAAIAAFVLEAAESYEPSPP